MYFFYYYPLGVDVPRDRIPVVTLLLGISMLALFLLSVPFAHLTDVSWWRYAYRPAIVSYVTPLTAIFLHASWLHVLGNLVYLWVFGPALERALGRSGFLLIFIGCGYVGNLAQGAMTLELRPDLVTSGVIGASGAISGLMGLFLLRFFYARLLIGYWAFLPLQAVNRAGTVRLPIGVGVLMWLMLQLVLSLVHKAGGGTAYGAHIGGLLTGIFVACSLGQLSRGRRDRLKARAQQESREGNYHGAVARMERYLEQAPWDEAALLEYLRLLCLSGEWGESQRRYRDLVCQKIGRGELEDACRIHLEARRGNNSFTLPPKQQRDVAFWLEKQGNYAGAVTVHLDFARTYSKGGDAGHSLARAATLLIKRIGDRDEGMAVLDEAIERHPDQHWRELLKREREKLGGSRRRVDPFAPRKVSLRGIPRTRY